MNDFMFFFIFYTTGNKQFPRRGITHTYSSSSTAGFTQYLSKLGGQQLK
jgi:hypothetical protein